MRSIALLSFGLLGVLGAAAPGQDAAGEVTLRPETARPVYFKKCGHRIAAAESRPPWVKAAPLGKLRWYRVPWGDHEIAVCSNGRDVRADTDRDGDLAEETPARRNAELGAKTLELPVTVGDREIPATVGVEDSGELRLINFTRMSGRVTIGGREVAFSLTDYLANGKYDDYRTTKTAEYWLCDHAHFDVDGNGEFTQRIPPRGEDFSLARGYTFGEEVYGLEVLRNGAAIRFERMDRKLVTVKVNTPDFTISLVSDEFGACHLKGKNGTARLPEGKYELDYYEYRIKKTRIRGLWWPEDGPARSITLREGLAFPLKGPLRYELFTEQKRGTLTLWSIPYGPNGARVMIWPNERRSIKPTIRVRDETGEELFSVLSGYC